MYHKPDGMIISYDEFETLCQEFENGKIKKQYWWPSMEEVEQWILPNAMDCYEFIIYILEGGFPPRTKEEKEVAEVLNGLIDKITRFTEEDTNKKLKKKRA